MVVGARSHPQTRQVVEHDQIASSRLDNELPMFGDVGRAIRECRAEADAGGVEQERIDADPACIVGRRPDSTTRPALTHAKPALFLVAPAGERWAPCTGTPDAN